MENKEIHKGYQLVIIDNDDKKTVIKNVLKNSIDFNWTWGNSEYREAYCKIVAVDTLTNLSYSVYIDDTKTEVYNLPSEHTKKITTLIYNDVEIWNHFDGFSNNKLHDLLIKTENELSNIKKFTNKLKNKIEYWKDILEEVKYSHTDVEEMSKDINELYVKIQKIKENLYVSWD